MRFSIPMDIPMRERAWAEKVKSLEFRKIKVNPRRRKYIEVAGAIIAVSGAIFE